MFFFFFWVDRPQIQITIDLRWIQLFFYIYILIGDGYYLTYTLLTFLFVFVFVCLFVCLFVFLIYFYLIESTHCLLDV